jgi:hypothetical protein
MRKQQTKQAKLGAKWQAPRALADAAAPRDLYPSAPLQSTEDEGPVVPPCPPNPTPEQLREHQAALIVAHGRRAAAIDARRRS